MGKNHKNSHGKIESCHHRHNYIQDTRCCIFTKDNHSCNEYQKNTGNKGLNGKGIFKGGGHGVSDNLTDSCPANKAG